MVVKPLEQRRDPSARRRAARVDRPQQLVSAAAQLLSQLTQFAGVVDDAEAARGASFRHLEFLRLSERRVLLIIVTPEGDVQNRILHTDRAVFATRSSIEATNFFNQNFAGQSLRDRSASGSRDELRALREDIAAPDDRGASTPGEGALAEGEALRA